MYCKKIIKKSKVIVLTFKKQYSKIILQILKFCLYKHDSVGKNIIRVKI